MPVLSQTTCPSCLHMHNHSFQVPLRQCRGDSTICQTYMEFLHCYLQLARRVDFHAGLLLPRIQLLLLVVTE